MKRCISSRSYGRCGGSARPGSDYCWNHDPEGGKSQRRRCSGVSKTGIPCTLVVPGHQDKCHWHQGSDELLVEREPELEERRLPNLVADEASGP